MNDSANSPMLFLPAPEYGQVATRQVQRDSARQTVLSYYLNAIAKAPRGRKDSAKADFVAAYNTGAAWPDLFAETGKISIKTLERWKKNPAAMSDRRGQWNRGATCLSEIEQAVLLRLAKNPNQPPIEEAIRNAHRVLRARGIRPSASPATYRRFLEKWITKNYPMWIFGREGAKAWNDKCAFYIERDSNLLNVGDVVVADGHTLNFEILNPWTGKPKRMTLILWYDMRSNYPLGWEIMPTENTKAILAAFRRAILRLGRIPSVAYLDNGRAFRSRFFASCRDFEDTGLTGLFERLRVGAIYAWPYHGQSKTVERFFGTFAELERLNALSYTGTSIEKKPPRLHRGERLHRRVHEKIFGDQVLTLEQTHRAIAAWIDDYAQRPQKGHLNGACPQEVFDEGKGPGVDAVALRFLMLEERIATIHRNGIRFLGQNYYSPELYERRHPVVIKYDLHDPNYILVFDEAGEWVCEARPIDKAHPAANLLGTEEDRDHLKNLIDFKKDQERQANKDMREFLEKEVLPEHRLIMHNMGIDTETQTPIPDPVALLPEATLEKQLAEAEAAQAQLLAAEADAKRKNFGNMSEMEKYDVMMELEAQGFRLKPHEAAFMRYFEATDTYKKFADYYESRKQALML